MSVSPADVEHLIARLVFQYASTEEALLRLIAGAVTTGDPANPQWVTGRRQATPRVRADVEDLVRAHDTRVQALVAGLLVAAYQVGEGAALKDAKDGVPVVMSAAAIGGLVAIWTAQLGLRVRGTHRRMAVVAMDWYTAAVDNAADRAAELGIPQTGAPTVTARVAATRAKQTRFTGHTMELTPAEQVKAAAQQVLTRAAQRGITGYVDADGKDWSLLSYVNHATRVATARAVMRGATRTWVNVGLPLAYVSVSPEGCSLCRPWETEVIALTDTSEEGLPVHVKGTLAEAILAGLFHPYCTHRLRPYVHGEVVRPTRLPVNPDRDRQVRRLRYLERQLVIAKRERAAAVTPAAVKAAKTRVRWRQSQVRDHVAITGLQRKRRREQLPIEQTT